jgi:hypothetical protein
MIVNFFFLIVAAVAWIAALWFGLRPNFAAWPQGTLIAVHAAPPVLLWSVWRLFSAFRVKRQQRLVQEKEAEQAALHAKTLATARRQHADDLATRRFHCETRWIDLRIKAARPAAMPALDLSNVRLALSPAEPDAQDDEFSVTRQADEPSAIGGFAPQLYEALLALYDQCPAASALPLYVVPPSGLIGEEVLTGLRQIHRELVAAMEPTPALADGGPIFRYLPHAASAGNAVLSVFESDPDLPGIVVLAFDSPLAFGPSAGATGKASVPGQAVVALLFTAMGLNPRLASQAGAPNVDPTDALTPYWQRGPVASSRLKFLSNLSPAMCETLRQLPVLAQIRRAACRAAELAARPLDRTRTLQTVLQEARINAGLLTPPLIIDGAIADAPETVASEPGWLVHNLGGGPRAAGELAALGAAMAHHTIDLDLATQATSTPAVLGDLGAAADMSALALSALQCAAAHQPVLCAAFEDAEAGAVAVLFATPAAEAPAEPASPATVKGNQ